MEKAGPEFFIKQISYCLKECFYDKLFSMAKEQTTLAPSLQTSFLLTELSRWQEELPANTVAYVWLGPIFIYWQTFNNDPETAFINTGCQNAILNSDK